MPGDRRGGEDDRGAPSVTITRAQHRFSSALTQILISIVVLNLFVEHVHTVVIDSFSISILTTVLLWLMLRVITRLERRVAECFRRKEGARYRLLMYLSVWAILSVPVPRRASGARLRARATPR